MVLRQSCILNEVLSLNAQEFSTVNVTGAGTSFLNEVLSLNAQESASRMMRRQVN